MIDRETSRNLLWMAKAGRRRAFMVAPSITVARVWRNHCLTNGLQVELMLMAEEYPGAPREVRVMAKKDGN